MCKFFRKCDVNRDPKLKAGRDYRGGVDHQKPVSIIHSLSLHLTQKRDRKTSQRVVDGTHFEMFVIVKCN